MGSTDKSVPRAHLGRGRRPRAGQWVPVRVRDLPGGPVAKTPPNARGPGWSPAQGTELT